MAVFDEQEQPQPSSGGSNYFTQKLGPLPMYAWIVIGFVAVFAYRKYKESKTTTATAATDSTTSTSATGSTADLDGATIVTEMEPGPLQQITQQVPTTTVTTPAKTATTTAPAVKATTPVVANPPTVKATAPTVRPVAKAPVAALKTYTVKTGDNLTKIATELGVPGGEPALYAANKTKIANPNLIYAGQVLTLPAGSK